MKSRKLRYVAMIVGLLVVVGMLASLKYCQISKLIGAGEQMAAAGPPPEAVGTSLARTASWESTLFAVGSVTGAESVAVSNDAPGLVQRIRFESGDVVRRGQVLVELDATPERAQLSSARSRRDLARLSVERARDLFGAGAVPREQLDRGKTDLAAATSDLSALEAQIGRKVVEAPFNGKLGIRAVNVGQYLNPGTTITTLTSLDELFVDFSVPQEQLAQVRVGQPVKIETQGAREVVTGKLVAIAPTLDAATRSVRLRATVADEKRSLRAGMFVRVSIVLPEREQLVIVPATAVVHAAYGDSVYTVQPKIPGSPGMNATPDGKLVKVARQQFVRLGTARGDFVVVAHGLVPGQEVVTAGAFKLRNGAPIVVDNTVALKPELDPRPSNR